MTANRLAKNGGKKRGRRRRSTAGASNQFELSAILAAASNSDEARENLVALLQTRHVGLAPEWRGRNAIPPGSLLDRVCDAFSRGSNIPLEIPLLLVLHIVSGFLLQQRVTIQTSAGVLSPRLWSIILADSSSGKTFALHQLLAGLGVPNPEIPGLAGVVSAAALFSTVAACPRGLLVRDEFGQLVGRIERDLNLSDFKDLLLRLYDGHPICWTTKKDGVRQIDGPEVAVLGLTQHATWHEKVSPESMLDGFAARFSVMIARPDPARHWRDYPVWRIQTETWSESWRACEKAVQSRYETTPAAEEYFCSEFRALAENTELPEPFFRRILFSCHRLACIYHVLLADPSPQLTSTDYAWSIRLLRHHLADAVAVVGAQNLSEIERLIQAAEKLQERCQAQGQSFNERALYKNFRALTPQTAGVILRILADRTKS